MRAQVDPDRLRATLEQLPGPRNRQFSPAAMATADALCLGAFRDAGWTAGLRPFEARDVPSWAASSGLDRAPAAVLPGVNVVAVKEGAESTDALVVVAHHDTVPDSAGADDNGSGVVALLELARLLAPVPLRRTVVLAAVDHEELGFYGSAQLVADLTGERRVLGALVYEMLGYSSAEPGSQRLPPKIGAIYRGQVRRIAERGHKGDFAAVIYGGSARPLAACFAECLTGLAGPEAAILLRAPADLPVIGPLLARKIPFVRDFARSDHVPFWAAGLPAVQITDTANFRNPHYHQAGDTPATLDYGRIADITAATAVAIERLAA
ncbi:MAG: hypothetical protein QOI35_1365 [Cryptosporangiaceae bacterium]|nr:hypothetical protein [Cryptosporangiaceae bacterium]MDQ1655943.1 hypothetical protein [Cryptosporangiaceae bacterium]